jgi:hypothetical protein
LLPAAAVMLSLAAPPETVSLEPTSCPFSSRFVAAESPTCRWKLPDETPTPSTSIEKLPVAGATNCRWESSPMPPSSLWATTAPELSSTRTDGSDKVPEPLLTPSTSTR